MRFVLIACLAILPAAAGELDDVTSGIELRYNRLATMQADFEQTVTYAGSVRDRQHGRLMLLRPGKMRWDYDRPRGMQLIGDGDLIRIFNPNTNQVRSLRVRETADMRAPLSFLLGGLNFSRLFRNLRLETVDGRRAIVAEGRTGKEAYTRVQFFYTPDYRLEEIRALGRNEALTTFTFDDEILNETLDPELFVFQVPVGAEILPETELGGSQ